MAANGDGDRGGTPVAEPAPYEPSSGSVVGFGIGGGCLGVLVGIVGGLIGGLSLIDWIGTAHPACSAAYGQAAVILTIVVVCAVVAWFAVIRPGQQTGLGLMAGWFAICLAVSIAIPWPCSYSFAVLSGLNACGTR